MIIEALIKDAIENLNRVKQLNLENIDIIEHLGDYEVEVLDNESGDHFNAVVNKDLLTQQLLPDDPNNLTPDKIIMLRIAKAIFEAYKVFKNNNLTYGGNPTISSLKLGSATYDIGVNGRSLTATFDELDDLKDKVEELKIEKQDLENQLKNLKSLVDLILNRCQDKGII
jgi:hypothetical protein